MLEEDLHCGEWAFKVNYGESSDKKRRTLEKASVFLENISFILNRTLLKMWTGRARCQKEARNILLDNGEKAVLVLN